MIEKLLNSLISARKVYYMKIEKVFISGFKNLKETELVFDNIMAIISLNSYGKSNLLEGINFAIDFISCGQRLKKNMMSFINYVPLNIKLATKDFHVEFEMSTTVDKINYKVKYGFQFMWVRSDNSGAKITSEWLKIKVDEKNQKYNNYIIRNEDKAYYRTSQSGRCSNRISIENSELVINKIEAYDSLFYLNIVKKINNLEMYIERHLDASKSYGSRFPNIIISDDDSIQMLDMNNIPRVINLLQKLYPDKLELLKDSYSQLFPSIIDIKVSELERKQDDNEKLRFEINIDSNIPLRLDNQIYTLDVTDKNINQPIGFEYISDGAKRVFLILVCILIADIKGYALIAIEEPENSVHPALLQKYLRIISQLSINCKIVITSHSPYIIQYFDPHNVYVDYQIMME
jgi:predicted ATPase